MGGNKFGFEYIEFEMPAEYPSGDIQLDILFQSPGDNELDVWFQVSQLKLCMIMKPLKSVDGEKQGTVGNKAPSLIARFSVKCDTYQDHRP